MDSIILYIPEINTPNIKEMFSDIETLMFKLNITNAIVIKEISTVKQFYASLAMDDPGNIILCNSLVKKILGIQYEKLISCISVSKLNGKNRNLLCLPNFPKVDTTIIMHYREVFL